MEIRIKISEEQLRPLGKDRWEITEEINRLVRKRVEELYIENNHFDLFKNKHLLLSEGESVKASELFKQYKSYCIKHKIEFIGRNKFYDLVCKLPEVYKQVANKNRLTLYNIRYVEDIKEEEEWL